MATIEGEARHLNLIVVALEQMKRQVPHLAFASSVTSNEDPNSCRHSRFYLNPKQWVSLSELNQHMAPSFAKLNKALTELLSTCSYGAILEKFRRHDPSIMGKIKGSIVDSAPVAAPDPQVWASGFSAAFQKKQSVATKGMLSSNGSGSGMMVAADSGVKAKPAVTEVALLAVLEKIFEVVLNLPAINRWQLPSDWLPIRILPTKVSTAGMQRRAGYEVRACDFVSSPHVYHFRSDPGLYTSQLTNFLEDCVLTSCKDLS
uniref:Uncharacterized protein LOC105055534 n=1 Tax=Elaeis guineensis var. tenera TaxID=51953 RepID=A0A8N4F281_ELAGV|nr:uncharacterized protein LOC105055534 [Elaeis guineensis]